MHRVGRHPHSTLTLASSALGVIAFGLTGCIPRDKTGFNAVGPVHRLEAIVLASEQTDDESLRGLIQQLDADDAAARLLAIRALQSRTGQTLDYRHDDPPWKRHAAVNRWIEWYQARDAEYPGTS